MAVSIKWTSLDGRDVKLPSFFVRLHIVYNVFCLSIYCKPSLRYMVLKTTSKTSARFRTKTIEIVTELNNSVYEVAQDKKKLYQYSNRQSVVGFPWVKVV